MPVWNVRRRWQKEWKPCDSRGPKMSRRRTETPKLRECSFLCWRLCTWGWFLLWHLTTNSSLRKCTNDLVVRASPNLIKQEQGGPVSVLLFRSPEKTSTDQGQIHPSSAEVGWFYLQQRSADARRHEWRCEARGRSSGNVRSSRDVNKKPPCSWRKMFTSSSRVRWVIKKRLLYLFLWGQMFLPIQYR